MPENWLRSETCTPQVSEVLSVREETQECDFLHGAIGRDGVYRCGTKEFAWGLGVGGLWVDRRGDRRDL